jgi:hypothetical protein
LFELVNAICPQIETKFSFRFQIHIYKLKMMLVRAVAQATAWIIKLPVGYYLINILPSFNGLL